MRIERSDTGACYMHCLLCIRGHSKGFCSLVCLPPGLQSTTLSLALSFIPMTAEDAQDRSTCNFAVQR